MSGFWKAGFWKPGLWNNGFWSGGTGPAPPPIPVPTAGTAGGTGRIFSTYATGTIYSRFN